VHAIRRHGNIGRNEWHGQNPQSDPFDKRPEMPEPEEHPVLRLLRELHPDELSPKEALERLYQLKKLV